MKSSEWVSVVEVKAASSVWRVHTATHAAQQARRVCDKVAAPEHVWQICFLKPTWRSSFLTMTPHTPPPVRTFGTQTINKLILTLHVFAVCVL